MPLLTPVQCRAQCRVDGDYADSELAWLLQSAEDVAAAYLNRVIFADQAALDAALASLPAEAAAAASAYAAAMSAASAEADHAKADAMRSVATQKLAAYQLAERRRLLGVVANGSILAAIRLTLGHLWANREDVSVGAVATELPLGARAILRPYRLVQTP
ncbi:MAG: head-tail connector protein [Xanthomonas sp.]